MTKTGGARPRPRKSKRDGTFIKIKRSYKGAARKRVKTAAELRKQRWK